MMPICVKGLYNPDTAVSSLYKVDDMKRLTMLFISIAAISFILLFSGCGQSGPLYVPGNPSTMAVPPSQTADEEEDQKEDSESPETGKQQEN